MGKLISALPPLKPVQIINLTTGELVSSNEHNAKVSQLVEYIATQTRDYYVQNSTKLEQDLLSDKRRIQPAEWARQNGYALPNKSELPEGVKAVSRVEKLYQHKLVSEVLAYVANPNLRKQAPSFAPKINLGAVDKQMCVLNIEDNQIHLDFKVWDEHYLLTFNIPHYLNTRDVKKWSLPTIELRKGEPYYVFSVEEKIPTRAPSHNQAGLDLGRVEPYTLAVVNKKGGRIAHYTTTPRLKHLNGKRERILREKSHILRKANHYDNLGLDSEALRLEAKRKARKALILGQETARQIGADITKKLSNHNVSILNVENLSWAVGKKYGSRWAHSQTQEATTHALLRTGRHVKKVNPKNTSQTCHKCGERVVHNSRTRLATCTECREKFDRDYNAAMNIAKKKTTRYPARKSRNGDKPSPLGQLVEDSPHNSIFKKPVLAKTAT